MDSTGVMKSDPIVANYAPIATVRRRRYNADSNQHNTRPPALPLFHRDQD